MQPPNRWALVAAAALLSVRGVKNYSAMAWRSHGKNNHDMITQLKSNKLFKFKFQARLITFTFIFVLDNGVIQSPEVEEAMKEVDRKHYSPHNPYMDAPQGIGFGATISAPHMVTHKV